jgi:FtsP/CotA-like multicopper oxidase with cupredoxin domain
VKSNFKLSRVAASVAVAITGLAVSQVALAGPGYVDATATDGVTTFRKQTFFAYSPSGVRTTAVPEAAPFDALTNPLGGKVLDALGNPIGQNTGAALRKFVDPLPLPGKANAKTMDNGTSKYIPVAKVTQWVNPQGVQTNDDYYEIAVVEFTDRFHSDLKKETTLRGYVQIDRLATNSGGTVTMGPDSVALTYPDGTPILVTKTDAHDKLIPGVKVQAWAVEKPRFLGPVILANKGTPTRLKVLNLLPVGRAEAAIDTNGVWNVSKRNGDLFLPVDKSILGAGVGPDGITEYTQNRASVHLHGGDTPWISDGTPHQWITPAGENDGSLDGSVVDGNKKPLSLAADFNNQGLDPALLPNYLKGASTANVPDMNDPGDGAMTLYYPNGQSARFIWYHDHTFGSTRLNVYAGMASAYLISDSTEQAMIDNSLPPAERTIPLVLQDRTFVPDDIALQDARWNTSAWGQPGDSWFPHVYETVQDPAQANNWNAVGRWHYGPWFWPVFPALYALPEGTYSPAGEINTVTTTPEGWNDTPIINGVAYPTLTVDPTTYRFRLLNASNDRMMTFNLFKATDNPTLADGSFAGVSPQGATEVNMIQAALPPLATDVCAGGATRSTPLPSGKPCIPETWPTDGRMGGVPSPADQGPTIYQIANEAGWLPKVAVFEPTPINYVQDKGRIVVLNVDLGRSGLFIAPAERADIVVDFSQYAGQTLLVYNDSGAPVPAGDPRNDLFTGIGDQSGSGGAEDTKPGYGPNTRTMMQIKVNAGVNPAMDVAALETAISDAYFSDPERRPIVAQDVYSKFAGAGGWANMTPAEMYGDIYLGSLKNPTFQFTPGTPDNGVASIKVDNQGGGYTVAPQVVIAPPPPGAGNKTATALATMKLDKIKVDISGTGYTAAPLVTFAGGGGSGAVARSYLRTSVTPVVPTAKGLYKLAGQNYTGPMQVNFTPAPLGGTTTTGYANAVNGLVETITIVNPGKGYTAVPLVTVVAKTVTYIAPVAPDLFGTISKVGAAALTVGSVAKASVKGEVDAVELYGLDNSTPALTLSTSGGGGYTDLRTLQINLNGGGGTGATATATGRVFDVTLTHPGVGYASNPSVAFNQMIDGVLTDPLVLAAATATAAVDPNAKASYLVKTKTIQELFDPTYGRLNATLGVELPFTSALTQTTIPLGYVDEHTEEFADGETQIWKITHNGVDSHPVHFHLLNVQVINRVGWDGFIQPIEPREMGWKETVMMSPLEDIIVAVRAKKPTLPGFGVPLSQRLMDPTQPEGSPFGFTQIDPVSGNPKVVTNAVVNFGWEYVWHCHILGHEENDFMRPIKFNANELMPASAAPTVTASVNLATAVATINFTDNSTTEYKFSVRRAPVTLNLDGTVNSVGAYTEIGTELALSTPTPGSSFVDTTPLAANQAYSYQVAAIGAAGEAASAAQVSTYAAPSAVTGLLAAPNVNPRKVTLTWTSVSPATAYTIVRTGGAGAVTFNVPAPATGYVDGTALANVPYTYTVTSVNGDKVSATASVNAIAIIDITLAAPDTLSTTVITNRITVRWVDQSTAETRFQVQRSTNGGATWSNIGSTTTASSAGTGGTLAYNDNTIVAGTTYTYRVIAQRLVNTTYISGPASATITVAALDPLVAPDILSATATTGRITVRWVDRSTTETRFQVQRSSNGGTTWSNIGNTTTVSSAGTGGTLSYNDNAVVSGTTYTYRVIAQRLVNTTYISGLASATVTAAAL